KATSSENIRQEIVLNLGIYVASPWFFDLRVLKIYGGNSDFLLPMGIIDSQTLLGNGGFFTKC
ncbi:MAG: hypothetical protein U9R24_03150, partial [Thermodesulfobacteriota bacterium]|nr:hypothetical protein [Thermodesulfobacteriota bacterium]